MLVLEREIIFKKIYLTARTPRNANATALDIIFVWGHCVRLCVCFSVYIYIYKIMLVLEREIIFIKIYLKFCLGLISILF